MTAEKYRSKVMESMVGMAFGSVSDIQTYLKNIYSGEFVSVSDLQISDNNLENNFVDVTLGENEYYTLFLVQGRSGRYYIVEIG